MLEPSAWICAATVSRQGPNWGMWRAKVDSCIFSKTASDALGSNIGGQKVFHWIGS